MEKVQTSSSEDEEGSWVFDEEERNADKSEGKNIEAEYPSPAEFDTLSEGKKKAKGIRENMSELELYRKATRDHRRAIKALQLAVVKLQEEVASLQMERDKYKEAAKGKGPNEDGKKDKTKEKEKGSKDDKSTEKRVKNVSSRDKNDVGR